MEFIFGDGFVVLINYKKQCVKNKYVYVYIYKLEYGENVGVN